MSLAVRGLTRSLAALALAAGVAAADGAAQQPAPRRPAPAPAAAPVAPAFQPASGDYQFIYDIDLLGTHVITLAVDMTLGHNAYDVAARINTVGMANWLFTWTQTIASQGAITATAFDPAQHRTDSDFRGRKRTAEIEYAEGQIAKVTLDPKPREEEFSDRQRAATRDPISAVIGLIYNANQGKSCGGRQAVFDGRRRYDIVITDMPRVKDDGAPPGTLLSCQIEFQSIEGELKKKKPEDADRKPRPNDTARVWMGPIESVNVIAPKRIEFEAAIGTMNLVLREAKYRVDVAAGPRPKLLPQR
jgi:hypothetical protein